MRLLGAWGGQEEDGCDLTSLCSKIQEREQKMLYGECWLAEAWEGGRSVPWEGVGRERMESRNLPGRGGQG